MRLILQTSGLAETLANKLNDTLKEHERVVWLVPGGSNVPISVAAMKLVDEALSAKLIIMQTDERFVPTHDPDNNWHQLQLAGFEVKRAETYPIVQEDGLSFEQTVENYQKIVKEQFTKADYIIGQFGIGPDGHIAGILPQSPAASTQSLVSGYHTEKFTRVTLTFEALKSVDLALAFAYGQEKFAALHNLQAGLMPTQDLPAKILMSIRHSTVYNDQIEGEGNAA